MTGQRPNVEPDDWLRAIEVLMRRAADRRWHGQIQINFYNGRVDRVITTSSNVDPVAIIDADRNGLLT